MTRAPSEPFTRTLQTAKKPPQHRACTRTDRASWATYIIGAVVTLAATFGPTWPKWQAVALALALGTCIGTAMRDVWWRKALRETASDPVQQKQEQGSSRTSLTARLDQAANQSQQEGD